MGMRVGGAASSATMSAWQSRRQDFGSLAAAIKGGDLAAAQQAFAKLSGASGSTSAASATSATSTATSATSGTGSSTDTSPLAAIGQALSSGDIKGAQQALANLFTNGAGGGGHHHHHHGGQGTSAPAPATPPLPAGSTVSVLA